MAAAGFQFGTGASAGTGTSTGSNLFQLGGNKTTAPAFPTFGAATTGASSGLTFGAKSTAAAGATPLFSIPGSSAPATGLLGNVAPQAATTSSFSLLGKPASTAATVAPFGFGTSTASNVAATAQPLFGAVNATTLTTAAVPATTSATVVLKQPDNPKEADVPPELAATVQALEKHIKDQKAKKDEISRYSCKAIAKVQEEIGTLKQSLSVVSNGIQRDGIGVEMLKMQAAHDLKNAEIAQNVKEMAPSLRHDYTAPIEYFQRLIQSFEERIIIYKQELDDLETYLSSATPTQEFTPQGLLDVLKKLGDTFLALTAQMQVIHEEVKILKNKYLQYRKVILGDSTNLFNRRKKGLDGNGRPISVGPSPFTALAGPTAVAMATALNSNINVPRPTAGVFGAQTRPPALLKTVNTPGLSRSLSFGGIGGQKSSFGQQPVGLGSSLIGGKIGFGSTRPVLGTTQPAFGTSQSGFKPSTGLLAQPAFGTTATPALNTVTPFQQPNRFQLQNPPSGTKRGKLK